MTKLIFAHRRKLDLLLTVLTLLVLYWLDEPLKVLGFGRATAIAMVAIAYGYWNYLLGQMQAHAKHDLEWAQDKEEMAQLLKTARLISENNRAIIRTMRDKEADHG